MQGEWRARSERDRERVHTAARLHFYSSLLCEYIYIFKVVSRHSSMALLLLRHSMDALQAAMLDMEGVAGVTGSGHARHRSREPAAASVTREMYD